MTALRSYLKTYLDGWRSDLDPDWHAFFDGVEPDFDAIQPELVFDPDYPVIPPLRSRPLSGAPAGAHIFRAFDGVSPDAVRVVLIGQDPYPRVSRATGRAFEDGALGDWQGQVAVSLQRLMQSAVSLRYGRPELARSAGDWAAVQAAAAAGEIALEPPGAWFDRLQASGVLFVNAGWTLTRFVSGGGDEQKCHIAMWRPLMRRLLQGLAERPGEPTVFLLLGNFAKQLFEESGVEAGAEAGGYADRVRAVRHPHPNAAEPSGYLARGNPLERVNAALAGLGAPAVAW
jgi:uracil-DNA glycosylase